MRMRPICTVRTGTRPSRPTRIMSMRAVPTITTTTRASVGSAGPAWQRHLPALSAPSSALRVSTLPAICPAIPTIATTPF